MKINIFILSVFLLCAQGFALRAEAEAPWYNTSWAYRAKVTIDHNKVASTTSTLLTNFPTLINTTITSIKDTSNSGHVGQSDGGDILFTSSDGVTKLNHEIEKYSSSTGELIAWIQVPTISTSTNTDIYMYYGNATVADQWNATATWDSDFKGVWHLKEATDVNNVDSTSNGNTGTPTNGPVQATGKIDGSLAFDGVNDYVNAGHGTSLDITDTITISAWIKLDRINNFHGVVGKTGAIWTDVTYSTRIDSANQYSFYTYGTSGQDLTGGTADLNWHNVVYWFSKPTKRIYVDGKKVAETSWNQSIRANTQDLSIGAYAWGSGLSYLTKGNIDDVKISNTARSADWIKTEYNNQSSPSTFYSVASENSQPFLRPMMSSLNYQINTDSINIGGTENSMSGELVLSDTLGEVGTGVSSSSNYSVSAGYRMLQGSYISISAAPNITMPAMSGMISGESNSSESWIVKTDNSAGYEMMVRAETSPALKSDYGSFSDYSPTVSNTPDYIFSVGSASSTFAFSPEGIDISQKYLDNGLGSACGTGNTDTQDRCWDGFSTTDKVVAHRTSSNHPLGTATTIKYKTAIGSNKIQESGTYTSTIVVTAVAL